MTGESFYSCMKNTFYPWLVNSNIEFAVVLYVDNHASHVNLQLLEFCIEKLIELIALYPNLTHLSQPLNVAFFTLLKKLIKKAVTNYKIMNEIVDLKKKWSLSYYKMLFRIWTTKKA